MDEWQASSCFLFHRTLCARCCIKTKGRMPTKSQRERWVCAVHGLIFMKTAENSSSNSSTIPIFMVSHMVVLFVLFGSRLYHHPHFLATDELQVIWLLFAHSQCFALRFHRMANDVKVEQNYSRIQSKHQKRHRNGKEKTHKNSIWENKFLFIIWSLLFLLPWTKCPNIRQTEKWPSIVCHSGSYLLFLFYLHLFTVTVIVIVIRSIWCSIIRVFSERKILFFF